MSMHKNHPEHYVLWLEIGTNSDNDELKTKLLNMFSSFRTYEEPNTCVNFISSLSEEQSCVFLILINIQCEYLAEMIIDWPQIAYIYLYNHTNEQILSSDNNYIPFSTANFKDLFYALARDIELKDGIPPPITVFTYNATTSERSVRDLCSDHQSATFIWFQLLVEVIRGLPHTPTDKQEMIDFLREYFHDCIVEQRQLDCFVNEYNSTEAIQWYTKSGFTFRVLNRALRTQNIDNTLFLLAYACKTNGTHIPNLN